jgi:hypothetical protein
LAAISFDHADDARTALHAIVSDPAHGKDALSSPQTMSNLLQDLLPDAPRETGLLMAAANAGLPAALREHVALGMDVATAIGLVAATLAAKTAFPRPACAWVATELAVALGLASPDIQVAMPAGDEADPGPVGPGQVSTGQAGPGQTQVAQAGPELAGAPGQVGPGQVGPGQVGAGQVGLGQVGAAQTQAVQFGAAPAGQGGADSWQRAQGTDPATGAGWIGPTAPLVPPPPAQPHRRMAPAVLVGTCIVVAGGVVAAAIILGSASHSSSPSQGASSPSGSGGSVSTSPNPRPTGSHSTPHGGGSTTSYHRVATLNPGAPGSMTNVVWTSDNSVVATSDKNGTTYLWNPATGQMTGSFPAPSGAGQAFATAISPDGSLLATGYQNGRTYLWNIASRKLIATLPDPGGREVDSVAFSPDGRTLVSADGNGYAYVWRVGSAHPSSTPVMSLADPAGAGVWSAIFSSNGTLATGDYHGNIYLWNLSSGSPSSQLTVPDGYYVSALAFSRDGNVLAAGTSAGGNGPAGGLYLFNTSTQAEQDIINTEAVWGLSFSGSMLAAAEDNGDT